MNEKVYKYIKEHPHTGITEISKLFDGNGLDVQRAVDELVSAGYIKMDPAVPLSADNDCSCYYTATRKTFPEQLYRICGDE